MNWLRAIADLRREIRQWVSEYVVPSLVVNTSVAKSSAIGNDDALDLSDQNDGQRPAVRTHPFGFLGMPPKGLRAYALRLGSSNVIFFGIAPQEKYGKQNLKAGETVVYSEKVEDGMHLDEDGNNKLNSASGKDVVVNGGTKKVARVDDTAKAAAALKTWMGQVESAITGLGGVTPTPAASTFADVSVAVINSGADNFKG